jgi:2',3'-cyclic-nucleotide 2'-phosphodiesterase (5'-nucleotidase family)
MGGFARRTSYWNAFARKYPGRPFLKIDGGSLFSAGALESPTVNRWMVQGTHESRLDAVNLTAWDLPAWQELSDLAQAGRLNAEWLKVPLVSANVMPKIPGFPAVQRYLVREIAADPKGTKRLRVGITGLLHDPEERISRTDFDILEPETAARQVLDEMKPRTDYRIVLTDQALGKAMSLALRTPGINILLVTHNYSTLSEAQQVGDTLLMMPVNEGRAISEVRLKIDSATGRVEATARFAPLERDVPDDPRMGDLVRKAQEEIEKARQGKASGE